MKAILLLSVFAVCSVAMDEGPSFCRGLDCPHFTVKKNTSDYQERCYQEYKWVSTVVAGYTYKKAVGMGFMRLFDYIEGQNNKSAKIPMTAPVLVQIQPAQGPYCKNNFTVNFFVPFAMQENPIPPTSKEVFVSSLPEMCAYVRTYGGFGSNTDDILKNAADLSEALLKDDLQDTYHKDFYYYAGYDSPFQLFDRHNDIWFMRK
ncbi:heme-binding protein 2 [Exaiptasia diaphana]|uniref:Heme-binding protein 2 n=1 Tax=Exaiptasia diaphana TaxID=2652724 RepID=A0A913Y2G7_EXADI|nr:heme-binding protein 2 [Exaiptasia diaphana]KXJ23003.1 Heme-binding protein 2 [Exaiptasia diaphana]